jgi:hypothetical protein
MQHHRRLEKDMSRVHYAGHGTWLKETRRASGVRTRLEKGSQGFAVEIVACLSLLALGFGIRIVGTYVF